MSEELKPCPFCGQPARAQHLPPCWFLLRDVGASRARLAQAWNRRATPTQHPAHSGSVDSAKFRELLFVWESAKVGPESQAARVALIAHIDTWAARRAVPEGYRLVPIKPTDDMIVAFAEQWYARQQCIDDPQMDEAYAAMLAAAPAPSSQPKEDDTKTEK